MVIKPNWDIFKAKFSENPQDNFEWFCYLLFSKEYNQPYGTHRYKNQSGIETDPIKANGEIIGWQSKFYEDTLSTHKDDLIGTLTKAKRDNPTITKIILYTNSEWGQGQGQKEPKAKTDTEEKASELGITLVWRVKSYFESPFVCIDNSLISKYFFTQGGFIPSFKSMSKIMKDNIRNVGKRYAPNNKQYELLNQTISIADIFNHYSYVNIVKLVNDYINLKPYSFSEDYSSFDGTKYIQEYVKNTEIGISKNQIVSFLEGLTEEVLKDYDTLNDNLFTVIEHLRGIKNTPWEYDTQNDKKDISDKYKILKQLKKLLFSNNILFYKKSLLLLSGEALIGKTHLFCDVTLLRLSNTQPTLLFFGNQFDGTKSIILNMITQLNLVFISEDEFLKILNMWGEEYNTFTLIMIDAINETENPKIWQDGIIKFCEQIKNYPNLALAMSVRDVEKNKIITPENEEYISSEIVEVEHKGFEGIELEAVRTFCEALEVEFPKVPIHTYRLFINPGMLFLYIETIKNSTKKVDTSIINPLTIFKSYVDDLERKYYHKYINEVDEEDEVVSEAIEEFISLGTQKDYLHFYLDYKDVKKKLKPLHNKILEFLISEGVLNKLKQESGTKVYFTYQKFENFFIANYLLNDFATHKDKIGDILFSHDNNALVEAFFMQIPQKLGHELFEVYPNMLDEYELCSLYFDSLVWREARYFRDKTFEYIEKIQNDWEGISSKYLEVILQLSSIPQHPLNILSFHQKLLDMTMLQRDYEWSLKIHNLFIADKIVKRIINWAWDKKEEFEIEDESLYLYGLTLGWFLTSSNRELRDGTTKALVNLFTDNVNVFLKVLKEFETVDDLYVLERLYAVGYGIVLRSSDENGFKEFGEYVYQTIFNRDEVVEHILLRDYAKLIVETIDWTIGLGLDMSKVLPPYGSNMPSSYPTLEEVENYQELEKNGYSLSNIIDSMRTGMLVMYGDFGRYTFQSALTYFGEDDSFDIQLLSNYVVKVIKDEYINDLELFSKIENLLSTGSTSRYDHKVERIGKKYQWLAMYKILAIVADNYKVKDGVSWEQNYINYSGVSELGIRDIDSTTILKEKNKKDDLWWFNMDDDFDNPTLGSNEEWLQSIDKLPLLSELVNVKQQDKKFLILDLFLTKQGNKELEYYRYLRYTVTSYIVKKDEFEDILTWVKKQNFYKGKISEPTSFYNNTHLREYPNSQAYRKTDIDYYGQLDWDNRCDDNLGLLPHKILLTTTSYLKERGTYDASLVDTISINLPNKWFINEMGLKQSLNDGEWINQKGEIVFFDPTIKSCCSHGFSDSGVLMATNDLLLDWLDDNGFKILWLLSGEKDIRNSDKEKFEESKFLGYGGISGYGYFEGDEFIENINIKMERPL